jgi:tryptophan-rich sensory protein
VSAIKSVLVHLATKAALNDHSLDRRHDNRCCVGGVYDCEVREVRPKASTQILGLAGWLLVTFAAAALGAVASIEAAPFYEHLVRPAWAPPASLFGPVWTTLYTMMAFAAWRVWRTGGFELQRLALVLFLAQLVLNALWSWLFFRFHQGALAFADIVILLVSLLATLVAFWRADRLAGLLLVPYIAWVSFASALNLAVWRLNPQVLG